MSSNMLSAAANTFEPAVSANINATNDTISNKADTGGADVAPVKKKKTKEERGPRKRHPKKKSGGVVSGAQQGGIASNLDQTKPADDASSVSYGSPFSLSSSFLLSSSLLLQTALFADNTHPEPEPEPEPEEPSSAAPQQENLHMFSPQGHAHEQTQTPAPAPAPVQGHTLIQGSPLATALSDLYTELSVPVGSGSGSCQLTLDDMERRKWSQWAIYAAEVERNRRIELIQAIDDEQAREREHRGQLAIALMERERLTRVSSQFAADMAATNWFNETFLSSYTLDYEIICPFHNRGCQSCFQRSSLAGHLEECVYAVEIAAHGSRQGGSSKIPAVPVDIEPSSSEHLDRNYEVMCPNSSLGCRHICALDDIQAHLSTCIFSGYISAEQEEIERNITKQLVILECEGERNRRVSEKGNASVSASGSDSGGDIANADPTSSSSTKLLSLHRLLNLQRQQLLARLYNQVRGHYDLRQARFATDVKPGVDALVAELKARLEGGWVHNVQVEAYGSYVTGCSGGDSAEDVDLVVCLDDETYTGLLSIYGVVPMLYQLVDHIRRDLPDLLTITEVLPQTKIPIIKGVARYWVGGAGADKGEGRSVNVDISIQGHGHMGLAAAEMVDSLSAALAPFRPIACLFKEYFKGMDLCDAYRGGIPSYGVLIMVLLPVLQYLRIDKQKKEQEQEQEQVQAQEKTEDDALPTLPLPLPLTLTLTLEDPVDAPPAAPTPLAAYSPSRSTTSLRPRSYSVSSVNTTSSGGSRGGNRRKGNSTRKSPSQFPRAVTFSNVIKRREYGRLVAIRLLELDEADPALLDLSRPLPVLLADQAGTGSAPPETNSNTSSVSSISYGIIISDMLSMYGELLEPGRHGFSARHAGFRFDLTGAALSVPGSPDIEGPVPAAVTTITIATAASDSNNTTGADAPPSPERCRSRSSSYTHVHAPRPPAVAVAHPQMLDPLIVEDPIDGINNVAKNCYKAGAIQRAVLDAHERLKSVYVRGLRGDVPCPPAALSPLRGEKVAGNRNSNPDCNVNCCNKCILSEVFGVCYKKP